MKYKVKFANQFKRDLKLAKIQGKDINKLFEEYRMALTAREWLLLPDEEQKRRKDELSPQECFLLRTNLEYICFTEVDKTSMTEQEKYEFIHPKVSTEEEKLAFNKQAEAIFGRLINEVEKEHQKKSCFK